ncbi:MAG: hypothetical protein ACJASI_001764 [Glaciecola sp.]|jgi:hypothetical protein
MKVLAALHLDGHWLSIAQLAKSFAMRIFLGECRLENQTKYDHKTACLHPIPTLILHIVEK